MGPCFLLVWISQEHRPLGLPHGWEKTPFLWILCYSHWNCTKLMALFWFGKWPRRLLPALLWDTALIWDLFELWLCCASRVWVEPDGVAVQRLWSPADNPEREALPGLPVGAHWSLSPESPSFPTSPCFRNISLFLYPDVWVEPTARCAFWYFLILLGRWRSLSHAAWLITVRVSCSTLPPNLVWGWFQTKYGWKNIRNAAKLN